MTWIQNIAKWRQLPPEMKLRRKWEAIPMDVAESMAFEREPVSLDVLEKQFRQIEPPALLRQAKAR